MIEITVTGGRTFSSDWAAARAIPKEQLPPLTPEERATAAQLRVPEENYARSAFAESKTQDKLLQKTERLARLLLEMLQSRSYPGTVQRVLLDTLDGKFEVEFRNGGTFEARIDEGLVDEIFETGSSDAERRLSRILDLVLEKRVA
jgi:hypothetical protein